MHCFVSQTVCACCVFVCTQSFMHLAPCCRKVDQLLSLTALVFLNVRLWFLLCHIINCSVIFSRAAKDLRVLRVLVKRWHVCSYAEDSQQDIFVCKNVHCVTERLRG